MNAIDLEALADSIVAERKPRQCETTFRVEPRPVFHTPPFHCASCGADHQRYRDKAHTKPAAWCAKCHADYVRQQRHNGKAP